MPDTSGHFSVCENRLSNKSVVCMEICKGLRYNFDGRCSIDWIYV